MPTTNINHANRLTDYARRKDVTTSDLAELVFDAATQKAVRKSKKVGPKRRNTIHQDCMWQAHEINRTGYFPQIAYLIDCYGPEETTRMLTYLAGDGHD